MSRTVRLLDSSWTRSENGECCGTSRPGAAPYQSIYRERFLLWVRLTFSCWTSLHVTRCLFPAPTQVAPVPSIGPFCDQVLANISRSPWTFGSVVVRATVEDPSLQSFNLYLGLTQSILGLLRILSSLKTPICFRLHLSTSIDFLLFAIRSDLVFATFADASLLLDIWFPSSFEAFPGTPTPNIPPSSSLVSAFLSQLEQLWTFCFCRHSRTPPSIANPSTIVQRWAKHLHGYPSPSKP